MVKNRNLTLESRIARLEKVLNKNAKRKFESFESDLDEAGARAAANRLAKQFANMIGSSVRPDDFGGGEVILSPMYGWLSVDRADEAADDPDARFAFHYTLDNGDFSIDVFPSDESVCLMDENGYFVSPEDGSLFDSDSADITAFPISMWGGFDLSMVHDEDDEDWDDDYDESFSRRRPRRESKIRGRKFSKNEDVYVTTLPNGDIANRVQDVLAGFTDTQWHRPDGAIKVLKRMGILDRAVNRWYPDADAVAEAIEDCWEDLIGGGNAVAKLYTSDDGDVTHCTLTLYPRVGGISRARNVILKFDWPNA